MSRGAQKATMAERIKALLLQGWADDLIIKTVGCSKSWLLTVKGDLQHELANGHHKQAG
jgi:hypothetical protein